VPGKGLAKEMKSSLRTKLEGGTTEFRLELVVQKDCPWIEVFRENLDDE